MPECRGFVQQGLTHWVSIPKCSVTGMLLPDEVMDLNDKKTNPRGQMCPCQCESQVPWLQAGFPIHNPTKPGTYLVLQYYIHSAHIWLHNPCLKNFLTALQGAWCFTLWRWETRQRAVGVLDWVYSAGCFGVCDSLSGGSPSVLLCWGRSQLRECSLWAAVNLPGHWHWEQEQKAPLQSFWETGQWRNKGMSASGWDWDFFGEGGDQRWVVLLSMTGLLSKAGHTVELHVHT